MPRLFIALPIHDEVVAQLSELTGSGPRDWRWVRPESLHVTLAFLGDVDEARVAAAERAMRRCAASARHLDLTAARVGAFPSEGRAKVLWAGLEGDVTRLHALQAELTNSLAAEGFELEDRSFRPHVTLARSRQPRQVPAVLDRTRSFGGWRASEVVLFESHLGSAGARYEVRASARLGVSPSEMGCTN